jgi:hypothetical protein
MNQTRRKKCWLTIATSIEVDDIAYPDVDHAQEALILLLELLLVKDLYGEDALFGDFAV